MMLGSKSHAMRKVFWNIWPHFRPLMMQATSSNPQDSGHVNNQKEIQICMCLRHGLAMWQCLPKRVNESAIMKF